LHVAKEPRKKESNGKVSERLSEYVPLSKEGGCFENKTPHSKVIEGNIRQIASKPHGN